MSAVEAGIRGRVGLALGLVVALAITSNAAINLLIPSPLYIPAALLLAVLAVLVAVRVGGCNASDLGLDREQLGHGFRLGAAVAALLRWCWPWSRPCQRPGTCLLTGGSTSTR
jgi:hypothetical protein